MTINEETMTPKERFDYRIKLLRDAADHKKTERIPFMGNIQQWMYLDAGYNQLEAARDYEKCEEAGRMLLSKYKMDIMSAGAGCVRNPTQLYDALGQNATWAASDDGNNINAIFEDEMIKADEYDELINNFEATVWEKAMRRNFPKTKDFTVEEWVNAAKAAKELMEARTNVAKHLREEFGNADEISVARASMFVGNLLNTYRGIKGLSMDMRRQPDKVAELCEKRDAMTIQNAINTLSKIEGHNMNEPYDITMGFLAHVIMTPKQFERYYVPGLEKVGRFCEEHGKQMSLNTEGDFLRFGDYFNDFKKGLLTAIVEMDDPYEVKKKLPNLAIIGGLSVDLMGNSTPKKCVDMAKRAIDELGRDGGLWLSCNKFVTYPYDMNSENLKAVSEFVVEYRA